MEKETKNTGQDAVKGKSKRFLVVYIIGLFSVALVLILLSYLTQVRANQQLESLQTKVTEQTTVAQGAQQQMETLQKTVQEQQKRLDETNAAIGEIRKQLSVPQEKKVEEAVDLLNDRYVALDALQQVRRLSATGDDTSAKELVQKMIVSYTAERLLPPEHEDAVLRGQNAIEFYQFCAQYGVQVTAVINGETVSVVAPAMPTPEGITPQGVDPS